MILKSKSFLPIDNDSADQKEIEEWSRGKKIINVESERKGNMTALTVWYWEQEAPLLDPYDSSKGPLYGDSNPVIPVDLTTDVDL